MLRVLQEKGIFVGKQITLNLKDLNQHKGNKKKHGGCGVVRPDVAHPVELFTTGSS